ncbi:MAG: hypothetical protein WCE68_13045 [Anaerolineales bacterium]
MPDNELVDTQAAPAQKGTARAVGRKLPGWLVALVLIALIAVGILAGYDSGLKVRSAAEETLVASQLLEQYQLGVQAVEAGQYAIAKQHFEFVLQNYPGFPGAQNAYTDLLAHMQTTPSAVPSLTPTSIPTPDLRGTDAIYNSVTALLSAPGANVCGRDWDTIIANLDTLRKVGPTYKTVDVDGMYYIALHNRGICKIYPQAYESNASCQTLNINLEGGIYDLTQAELFGPLDSNALALRTWARMYVDGASFWDQDWAQAQNYFAQVMANEPGLMDSACMTSTDRWRQATIAYAGQLMDAGDLCGAEKQFKALFATVNVPDNAQYGPTATHLRDACGGNRNTPSAPTKTP